MIQCFVWKVTEYNAQVIKNLLSATLKDREYKLFDIFFENIKNLTIVPENTVVFGQRALNLLELGPEADKVLLLPSPSSLVQSDKNKQARLEAYEALLSLNKVLDVESTALTDRELEKFLLNTLIGLKKKLADEKIDYWEGILPNNKKIIISLGSDTSAYEADILISFDELFAARCAMEIFGAEKLYPKRKL